MTLPTIISPGDPGHIGHHETIHSLLANVASPFRAAGFAADVLADRPVAGTAGHIFRATDVDEVYLDDGTEWSQIAIAVSANTFLFNGEPWIDIRYPTRAADSTGVVAAQVVIEASLEDADGGEVRF